MDNVHGVPLGTAGVQALQGALGCRPHPVPEGLETENPLMPRVPKRVRATALPAALGGRTCCPIDPPVRTPRRSRLAEWEPGPGTPQAGAEAEADVGEG